MATMVQIESVVRELCPEADVVEISSLGPGAVRVFVAREDRGPISPASVEALGAALYLVAGAHLFIGVETVKARKYPTTCPCGIASIDCDYHKDM